MAASVVAIFCFREVRGTAMHVQHHARSAVADFGVGMSHHIVEKFGDILAVLFVTWD